MAYTFSTALIDVFQIGITTTADLSGAQQAGKSLEDVGKKAEESAGHGRALAQALREVNPELGELGHLMHLTQMSAGIGGIMAFGLALQKLTERLEEVRQKIIETTAASIEMRERFEDAHIHAITAATEAQEKFAAALDAANHHRDAATEAMTRMIAVSKDETKETENRIDAELALDQAMLRRQVWEGKMSANAGSEANQALKRQSRAAKDAAEDAQSQAEANAKQARAQIASGEIDADTSALGPLRTRSQTEIEAMETQAGAVETARKEREDAKKALEDANAWGSQLSGGLAFSAVNGVLPMLVEWEDRKNLAQKRLTDAEGSLSGAEIQNGKLKSQHEATERQIAVLEQEIIARTELVSKLEQESREITEDLARHQSARAAAESMSDRAAAIERSTDREHAIATGKGIQDDIDEESGYQAGRSDASSATAAIESRINETKRNVTAGMTGANEALHSLLEAMACGLPVITTGIGPIREYATDRTALLLNYDLVPGGRDPVYGDHFKWGCWAEPDHQQLRQFMRRLFQNPAEGREIGRAAADDVRSKWTWTNAVRKAHQALRDAGIEE